MLKFLLGFLREKLVSNGGFWEGRAGQGGQTEILSFSSLLVLFKANALSESYSARSSHGQPLGFDPSYV
jgi:hypothetical protein